MKKTYKVKATKRAWVEVVADDSLTQDEIYELAKEKTTKGKVKWEEPSFNIIDIIIDDKVTGEVKPKVTGLEATDPLLK